MCVEVEGVCVEMEGEVLPYFVDGVYDRASIIISSLNINYS